MKDLFRMSEQQLGRPLRHIEQKSLVWMHDGNNIGSEIILTVLLYCKSIDKCSVNYAESIITQWWNEGIHTLTQVNDAINDMEYRRSFTGHIQKAFEMHRKPTTKQQEFIDMWQDKKIPMELIVYAYEKTVESTGKLVFEYLPRSQRSLGCRTLMPLRSSPPACSVFPPADQASAQVSMGHGQIPPSYVDIPYTLLIAPFSIMPTMVGSALWSLCNALLLYFAIKKLEFEKWKTAIIIWLSYNGLYLSVVTQQYNAAVAAFILFTFILVERKKDFWAALMIVLGTLTKIYGIVGLAFFLFSKRKLYFLWGILFWAFVLFVVPMFYTSPQYVFDSYKEWVSILEVKNDVNELSFYQNISLLGMVRKITHAVEYSDMWLIIPGIVLFLLPYLRIGQYENRNFRLSFLASVLLFMVLFSTGTEECGYVGALIGVGIWYVSTPTYKKSFVLNTCLLLFCFVLTAASSSSILFSKHFRTEYITSFALKALPCAIIWFKIIWEQLTQDYTSRTPTPFLHKKDDERIDVILPCYNPHEGWEQQLIEKHKELEGMLNGYNIRFIVVNDGSKRGFTEEAVLRLTNNLPNTIIVDNKINQGKGAAVRDGIAHSDSELALYTDYDFPYKIESVCQVIKYLEEGYDVVVANRNHTYYSQLSTRRKLASHASRFLNFMLLGLTHTDTQGGLKGFNCKGKAFLASTRIKQFLFDTEFIYKASLDDTTFIKEVPVDLRGEVMLPDMKKGVFVNELKNLLMICWRG